MKGVLSSVDLDEARLVQKAQASPGLVGRDLVREVIPDRAIEWSQPLSRWARLVESAPHAPDPSPPHVVALDYGMKWNIARHLFDMGCRVTILPGTATSAEVLEHKPDGVFLSNGPGDPEPLDYAQRTIRELLGKTADLRHLPWPSAPRLGLRGEDVQIEVWPSRGEPAGVELRHPPGGNHHAEPRFRGRGRFAPRRPGSDASKPQRQHDRGLASSPVSGLLRAVSSRGLGRSARQQLSLRRVPRRCWRRLETK